MRLITLALIVCCICVSCHTSSELQQTTDKRPLPDLIIKKVSYRTPTTSPHIIRQRAGVLEPTYEFELLIENIGNIPFSEPFLISYTKTQSDFQNSIYTQQKLLNETRAVIAPGKSMTFKMEAEVEVTRNTFGISTLPMRFLLNHEWGSYSKQPETIGERELNYDNNTYVLSLRLQGRR